MDGVSPIIWLFINMLFINVVRWLMSNKIAKSPLLGHSLENSLSKVLFPEELNGLVPQS